jgi:hypothetical protein
VGEWLQRNTKWAFYQVYPGENKLHSMRWGWGPFVLDQHAFLDIYIASSPKQQVVAPLGHIILISNQPVIVITPKQCVHRGETSTTNYIFLIWPNWGWNPRCGYQESVFNFIFNAMKYYNCQQTDELYVKYDQIIELLTSEVKMKKKKKRNATMSKSEQLIWNNRNSKPKEGIRVIITRNIPI